MELAGRGFRGGGGIRSSRGRSQVTPERTQASWLPVGHSLADSEEALSARSW